LIANSAQVVLLPLLAGGLWWITSSARFIGAQYRNRWWENLVMGLLFVLAVYGAINSIRSIAQFLQFGVAFAGIALSFHPAGIPTEFC
jgi:hypothetical protein